MSDENKSDRWPEAPEICSETLKRKLATSQKKALCYDSGMGFSKKRKVYGQL